MKSARGVGFEYVYRENVREWEEKCQRCRVRVRVSRECQRMGRKVPKVSGSSTCIERMSENGYITCCYSGAQFDLIEYSREQ